MIDEGMLILNAAANITRGATHQAVFETFLITFYDKISLNGTPYINHHKVLKKAPAVPSMAKINVTEHHQLLSLPFLLELCLGNLQRIGDLSKARFKGAIYP